MGMTIIEKILARASGAAKVAPGDLAVVDVDLAVLIDISFLRGSWREVLKVHDPEQGRRRLRPRRAGLEPRQRRRCTSRGREFASASASSASTMSGRTRGSAMSSSPRTPMRCPARCWSARTRIPAAAGAFNCAARGVGAPDLIYALTTGKTWFRVGETVRYDLDGRLAPASRPRMCSCTSPATYGDHANQNVEFGGAGLCRICRSTRAARLRRWAPSSPPSSPPSSRRGAARLRQGAQPGAVRAAIPRPRRRLRGAARASSSTRCEPLVALPDRVVRNSVPVGEVARREDPPGLHRLLRQRHARRSRRGGARAEGAPGRAGRAPASSRRARRRIATAAAQGRLRRRP